jgi:hypothetical protein
MVLDDNEPDLFNNLGMKKPIDIYNDVIAEEEEETLYIKDTKNLKIVKELDEKS